jgi:DNA-binding NarL/FixJ family response regulator
MPDCDINESAIRVLIVDDFELWRRHIVGELQKSARFTVVGEASDGPEALKKAGELAPGLILLDVGLPTMDGITVAAAIIRVAPDVKILMLSAHNGGSIVNAALLAGARGYLLKSDAGRELMPAIEAVVRGGVFVSTRIISDDVLSRDSVPSYPAMRR